MNKMFCLFTLFSMLLLPQADALAGDVTYIYTNPQGTPLAESDASGNVTAIFDYTPYGRQVAGGVAIGPGYTGHVKDADTDLVYMQARYYDPEIGLFLSMDPAAEGAGSTYALSGYAYARNSPAVNIDPDGRMVGAIYNDWRGGAWYPDPMSSNGQRYCQYCLGKTFGQKFKRNLGWLGKSINAEVGVRFGLNFKIKVNKLVHVEAGTGYLGVAGQLNAKFEFAMAYQEKGWTGMLRAGNTGAGHESSGVETRMPISVSGPKPLEEIHTQGFNGVKYFGRGEYTAADHKISVEVNPLILHGEVSVDTTGVLASIFYWGDQDNDPTE